MELFHLSTVKFHPWEHFQKVMLLADKVKIVSDMHEFNQKHSAVIYSGIKSNTLMRNQNHPRAAHRAKVATSNQYDALMETDEADEGENRSSLQEHVHQRQVELDTTLRNVTTVDFMKSHFLTSTGIQIFKHVTGVYDNGVEVTFSNKHWRISRAIERVYKLVVAKHMTDTSIQQGFENGQDLIQATKGNFQWKPPVLSPEEMDEEAPTQYQRHVEYSMTGTSNHLYRNAAMSGTRKVDLPMSLTVTRPAQANPYVTPRAKSTNVTPSVSTTTISTAVTQSQADSTQNTKYDEQFRQYDARLVLMASDLKSMKIVAEEAQKIAAQAVMDVKTNHTEVKSMFISHQKEVVETIKTCFTDRFRKIDEKSDEQLDILKALMKRSKDEDNRYNNNYYDDDQYDMHGYDVNGYDERGYDANGYDVNGEYDDSYDADDYDDRYFDDEHYDERYDTPPNMNAGYATNNQHSSLGTNHPGDTNKNIQSGNRTTSAAAGKQ